MFLLPYKLESCVNLSFLLYIKYWISCYPKISLFQEDVCSVILNINSNTVQTELVHVQCADTTAVPTGVYVLARRSVSLFIHQGSDPDKTWSSRKM